MSEDKEMGDNIPETKEGKERSSGTCTENVFTVEARFNGREPRTYNGVVYDNRWREIPFRRSLEGGIPGSSRLGFSPVVMGERYLPYESALALRWQYLPYESALALRWQFVASLAHDPDPANNPFSLRHSFNLLLWETRLVRHALKVEYSIRCMIEEPIEELSEHSFKERFRHKKNQAEPTESTK